MIFHGTSEQYCEAAGGEGAISMRRGREGRRGTGRAHLLPVVAVLDAARLVVARLAVDEQDHEVYDVKVGQGRGEAGRQAPGAAAQGQGASEGDSVSEAFPERAEVGTGRGRTP